MSVINQALKDLQTRQQAGKGRARSVYQAPKASPWPWVFGITLGVLAGGAVVWQVQSAVQASPATQPNQTSQHTDASSPSVPNQSIARELSANDSLNDNLAPMTAMPAVVLTPDVTSPVEVVHEHVQENLISASPAPDNQAQENQVQDTQRRASEAEAPPAQAPSSMAVERVERSAPELARQRLDQAVAALESGQGRRAETLLQEALVLQPDLVDARQRLAAYYFGRGFNGEALRILEEGLLLAPNQIRLITLTARIYEEAGRPEQALTTLNRYSAELPRDQDVVILRAAMANEQSRYELAAEDYRALLRTNTRHGLWWLGLAYAEEGQGHASQALEAYQRALEDAGLDRQSRAYAQQRMEAIAAW
ncbi:MAG: tetratricopeptide repeat protein [Firmicutes bacterium]|nr:tetratricopeptide repeat protein [Bacillota bacterium]